MSTTRSVKPDTLRCSVCRQWLPDDDYYINRGLPVRRNRTYRCKTCFKANTNKNETGTLRCAICGVYQRRPDQYVCWMCCHEEMFNIKRPPEMQGRAVPIFTGRASSKPPIRAEREPGYWSQTYLGGM